MRKSWKSRIGATMGVVLLAVTFAAFAGAQPIAPITTNPFTGDVATQTYKVHGVVVHRIALENAFVLAGAKGGMLAITDSVPGTPLPPFGHRVAVSVERVGGTVQLLAIQKLGPFVPIVHLHGTVTFESPLGHRYTLSAGGASIPIHHRLRGAIPALDSVVTVGAKVTQKGLLVERRLIPGGHHSGALDAVGTLEAVIPPTPHAIATATEELVDGCPAGCIVISGDDQGAGNDAIPISLTTQGVTAGARALRAEPVAHAAALSWSFFAAIDQQIQQAAGALKKAKKKPKGTQPVITAGWNMVLNTPDEAVASAATVPACTSTGGDYSLLTSGACPAGTHRGRVSPTALTKVQNKGNACVTGLTLSGSTTDFIVGSGGCIAAQPGENVAAPVTLN